MNLELFNRFMRPKGRPGQWRSEWLMCLEVCETYLRKHEITEPIVVELGIRRGRQKKFWEQLLGAQHIGIDKSIKTGIPDIIGNTHDPKTLEMLKNKLKGKPINMLFIDASHHYKDVKKDFEIYSPLCDDIVMLHDIESDRFYHPKLKRREGVFEFWNELIKNAREEIGIYKDFLFLSIYQRCPGVNGYNMGIGVIIKK